MRTTIDINADLGESSGAAHLDHDGPLLDLVSSANIACGYHAGNSKTMADTVRAARDRGVAIGAHPSYPDLPGFGRRELGLSAEQIRIHVARQVRTMKEVCAGEGARLSYVKPHGALYNRAATDARAATAITEAILTVDPKLTLLGLAASEMGRAAARADLKFASEAFVDRAYRSDGTLLPRNEPNAIITDEEDAVERAFQLVNEGCIHTSDGATLHIEAQSLCVHGDNPDAASLLRKLRSRLEGAGVVITAFTS